MPEEIDVACPGCNAIFGVPVSFCGQTAECAECGSMFEIPELREKNLEDTSTGTIKGVEADDAGEATNTVRLSRAGIGMIPQLKDDYKLGSMPNAAKPKQSFKKTPSAPTVSKPPSPSSVSKPPTPKGLKPSAMPDSPQASSPSFGSAPTVQDIPHQAVQPLAVPNWAKIRIKKGEEVTGVRELVNSPAETAFLAVIPLIIAGAAGLLSPMIGTPVSAIIVGLTCVITFVVALVLSKGNSRKALIATNQRAIAVIGKNRIEIKK